MWGDHMVVQQGKPIVIEGRDVPGANINVYFGEIHGVTIADGDGRFKITVAAQEASLEPLTLKLDDGSGQLTTVSDILIGDVWLCGGQSNMQFSVAASAGGQFAIQGSKDDGLRLLMIPQTTAPTPQEEFGVPVKWAAASPETVPNFSGACYFMARKLRQDLKIPIGAIHSNWGGSQIRAWETPEAGRALYGADQMAQLEQSTTDMLGAVTSFASGWEDWWRNQTCGQQPWAEPDKLDWSPVPQISAWGEWTGTPLAKNGVANVWMRRIIDLTPAQARAGGTLNLGLIDDTDMSFVNGRAVGNTSSWSDERHYKVPANYLKPGANEVMVLVSNGWGPGGMESKPERLSFDVDGGTSIPLGEGWRYSIIHVAAFPPRTPWDGIAGIGVMYNRMIAPFGHFALKGAAWYQGESDVNIPGYAERLTQLFAGWRRQFGDMRMLVVQLPNYGPVATEPVESGWAEIREQQREAVAADSDAALVATLDIGERTNLHPLDKLDVGLRLAMAAQGVDLPMPLAAKRDSSAIVIDFAGIEGGLHAWSGDRPLGIELCGATQESCRYASAAIASDSLRIPLDDEPATRVRYAWAESPVVNLYDARALPVPGFELPISD